MEGIRSLRYRAALREFKEAAGPRPGLHLRCRMCFVHARRPRRDGVERSPPPSERRQAQRDASVALAAADGALAAPALSASPRPRAVGGGLPGQGERARGGRRRLRQEQGRPSRPALPRAAWPRCVPCLCSHCPTACVHRSTLPCLCLPRPSFHPPTAGPPSTDFLTSHVCHGARSVPALVHAGAPPGLLRKPRCHRLIYIRHQQPRATVPLSLNNPSKPPPTRTLAHSWHLAPRFGFWENVWNELERVLGEGHPTLCAPGGTATRARLCQ